jgi:hypothetical protein
MPFRDPWRGFDGRNVLFQTLRGSTMMSGTLAPVTRALMVLLVSTALGKGDVLRTKEGGSLH